MNKIIGIFGGTFDPIHCGHLNVAQHLLQYPCIEHIRLIPCQTPAHRDQPIASADDRLAMLKLSTQDEPNLIVDDRELRREGISYTVDTLLDLKQTFTQPLALIVGYDAWAGFFSWHRWQTILDNAHIIIVNRPQHALNNQAELAERQVNQPDDLCHQPAGLVYVDQQTDFNISATSLRQTLPQDKALAEHLPDSVLTYIKEHKLYTPTKNR